MMEELYKWRIAHPADVDTLNEESARKRAEEKGTKFKPGHATPPGVLSQHAAYYKLQEWHKKMAPPDGTVSRWMSILNCDNAGYFFKRLGEKEWKTVEFGVTEILDGFIGKHPDTFTLSCNRGLPVECEHWAGSAGVPGRGG